MALALAGSAVAIGAHRLGQRRTASGADALPAAASPDNAAPADETAQLAETVRKLERRIAALEFAQLSAKSAAPAATAAADHATGPIDPAEAKQRIADKAAAVEAALKTEPRDRNWASLTEGQVQAAVDAAVKDGAKLSVQTLRCMTNVCELVLSAPSADLLAGIDVQLASQLTELGSMDIQPPVTAANGAATVAYRMFRKGRPRPDEGI